VKYNITHRTTYRYKYPVSVGNHIACLTPRNLPPHHCCLQHELRVRPATTSFQRTDYFGNRVTFFTVQEPHSRLVVEARSIVIIDDSKKLPAEKIPWESVVAGLRAPSDLQTIEACQFTFESPRIRTSRELSSYALQSFQPRRDFSEALLDLTDRIHREFQFDAKATSVRTSTEEVFQKRRGVCQDFAHLQIACLRSIGLAARYVSGYLRTYPLPGRPRLIGADASHAWAAAFCPGHGWIDVDPTNNVVPSFGHVTVAWGRDYGDVSPLRGLILGGRDHTLKVNVDVEPVDESQSGPSRPEPNEVST
jgi:transglutaminase-like putative cysteine protease